jgi:hypothetical protein
LKVKEICLDKVETVYINKVIMVKIIFLNKMIQNNTKWIKHHKTNLVIISNTRTLMEIYKNLINNKQVWMNINRIIKMKRLRLMNWIVSKTCLIMLYLSIKRMKKITLIMIILKLSRNYNYQI